MGMSIEEYKNTILQENEGKIKSFQRQLQGKINHGFGQNFEEQVESICEVYKMKGIAIIEKTPEPMKILKHIENGHFETIFTKSAQPDFKGTLKGGKTVVFDAKFTEKDRIRYQVLSDFQREALLNYNKLGAIAFVLVGFMNGDMYKVPIEEWENMTVHFGRKYMKQEELTEMGFMAKRKKGILDFLEILS